MFVSDNCRAGRTSLTVARSPQFFQAMAGPLAGEMPHALSREQQRGPSIAGASCTRPRKGAAFIRPVGIRQVYPRVTRPFRADHICHVHASVATSNGGYLARPMPQVC